jgi:hypothetical protein
MKIEWEIVENPAPDPEIDRLLDYMVECGRKADEYSWWIGTATAPAGEPA